jgi:hypothetical protein
VIEDLRKRNGLPVWLVGTSRGTISASNAAIRFSNEIAGLVLTSSVTKSGNGWEIVDSHPDGIMDMELNKITVPVQIVSHTEDECHVTPATDSDELKNKFTAAPMSQIKLFSGGLPPISSACSARSAHGFFGIEANVVETIANFIHQHPGG